MIVIGEAQVPMLMAKILPKVPRGSIDRHLDRSVFLILRDCPGSSVSSGAVAGTLAIFFPLLDGQLNGHVVAVGIVACAR